MTDPEQVVLFFAALLGLTPALIAERRGHSFLAWWLFGTALFIVALPAALLIVPDLEAEDRVAVTRGLRQCDWCAEWVRPDAVACRYCGRDIEAEPVAETVALGQEGDRWASWTPARLWLLVAVVAVIGGTTLFVLAQSRLH